MHCRRGPAADCKAGPVSGEARHVCPSGSSFVLVTRSDCGRSNECETSHEPQCRQSSSASFAASSTSPPEFRVLNVSRLILHLLSEAPVANFLRTSSQHFRPPPATALPALLSRHPLMTSFRLWSLHMLLATSSHDVLSSSALQDLLLKPALRTSYHDRFHGPLNPSGSPLTPLPLSTSCQDLLQAPRLRHPLATSSSLLQNLLWRLSLRRMSYHDLFPDRPRPPS